MPTLYSKEFEKVVTLKPPPIKEPFRTDENGKVTSPVWALWMQELVNRAELEAALSLMQLFQESMTVGTMDIQAHDVQQLFTSIKSESSSSIPDDDALKMIHSFTFEKENSSLPQQDAEVLCWMSF